MTDFCPGDYDDSARCPYCADIIDYCQGHGPTGDPQGHQALANHDQDNHNQCHPDGCHTIIDALGQYDPHRLDRANRGVLFQRHARKTAIHELRRIGLTYQNIAHITGLSKQRAHQIHTT